MPRPRALFVTTQACAYLVEVAVLAGALALAAAGESELALGPWGRLLGAVALPLPCHLMLLPHALRGDSRMRRPRVRALAAWQPLPARA